MRFRTGRFLFEFENKPDRQVNEYLAFYFAKVRMSAKDAICLGLTIMNFDFCLTFSI